MEAGGFLEQGSPPSTTSYIWDSLRSLPAAPSSSYGQTQKSPSDLPSNSIEVPARIPTTERASMFLATESEALRSRNSFRRMFRAMLCSIPSRNTGNIFRSKEVVNSGKDVEEFIKEVHDCYHSKARRLGNSFSRKPILKETHSQGNPFTRKSIHKEIHDECSEECAESFHKHEKAVPPYRSEDPRPSGKVLRIFRILIDRSTVKIRNLLNQ